MSDGELSYNGTTYRLRADRIADLLARGVIVADPAALGSYDLALEHLIEEIGDDAALIARKSGEEARGEGSDEGRRRMIAVRYMHRDNQGGGH